VLLTSRTRHALRAATDRCGASAGAGSAARQSIRTGLGSGACQKTLVDFGQYGPRIEPMIVLLRHPNRAKIYANSDLGLRELTLSVRPYTSVFFEVSSPTYHSPITVEVFTYRVLLGTLEYASSGEHCRPRNRLAPTPLRNVFSLGTEAPRPKVSNAARISVD
jgi:hypothetical protein